MEISQWNKMKLIIIIIIINKSRWLHYFLCLSVCPYHVLPPADYPNYIQRANINELLLVGLYWHVYVLGSIEKRGLFFCGVKLVWIQVWFGLVWFYGISTIVGLFNAKSSLNIYIKYVWFGLVWFYGISTIGGYLMPNPLYTYILNIYDLVWFGFMAYQPL